jgi:Flp pilus assembly protein TadD
LRSLEEIRSLMKDPFVYDETPCAKHLSGLLLLEAGRYDEALRELRGAADSSTREFLYFGKELAAGLDLAGKTENAERECMELLAFNPNDYNVLMLMEKMCAMNGDRAKALRYRNRALAVLQGSDPGFTPYESIKSKSES